MPKIGEAQPCSALSAGRHAGPAPELTTKARRTRRKPRRRDNPAENFAETQSHAAAFTLPSSPFTLHFPPTNTLDFPRAPALARSLAAAPASPRCELPKPPANPRSPMPARLIRTQAMQRSQGE